MPNRQLNELVVQRLEEEVHADDDWPALVLGALDGQDGLLAMLADAAGDGAGDGVGPVANDTSTATRSAGKEAGTPDSAQPAGPAFLRAITVQGFRGIGPEATLEIAPGPGLTLVVGRNGCGKSSFAEALELLLTGDTYRWKARKTVMWREGWRNLHHPDSAVRTELLLEGESGPCTVAREWNGSEQLEDARTWAQVRGKPRAELTDLGWDEALSTHRPFLSYNELGSLLDDGPSKLYDALAAILGLDDLVDAQNLLRDERSRREKALKEARGRREALQGLLEEFDDPRAIQAAEALAADDWGLEAIAQILTGGTGPDDRNVIQTLRGLATVSAPDPTEVAARAEALRGAARETREAGETLAARSADLADLLDRALGFRATHGGDDCPVCGTAGAVADPWSQARTEEVARLREEARRVESARSALARARAALVDYPLPDASLLERAAGAGLGELAAGVVAALERWEQAVQAEDADAVADAAKEAAINLAQAVGRLRERAEQELGRREDVWRPVATALAEWLPGARSAQSEGAVVPDLKRAEAWLKGAAGDIRNRRFAPIADRAVAIWEQLRLQSSVSLGAVRLGGSGNRRRVDLQVTVDGKEGTALGVMSQGELHSLALSLFIPRATLPESPFRFVVIDDPVQSMDPARVEGLARVLEAAARDRQVLVFTHDDRLPEAVRRLDIDARVLEVTRREGSVVEVREANDPVSRYIEDAMALARTQGLPAEAARRVVPGLCREALEAACMEVVRRRRLGRGEPHAVVEEELLRSQKLLRLLALAVFDDADRAGDVLTRLNQELGRRTADTVQQCKGGAHGDFRGDGLVDFVRDVEKLTQWLGGRK